MFEHRRNESREVDIRDTQLRQEGGRMEVQVSHWLMKILIFEYLIIMGSYLIGRDWARAAYFLGATILNVSILWMK